MRSARRRNARPGARGRPGPNRGEAGRAPRAPRRWEDELRELFEEAQRRMEQPPWGESLPEEVPRPEPPVPEFAAPGVPPVTEAPAKAEPATTPKTPVPPSVRVSPKPKDYGSPYRDMGEWEGGFDPAPVPADIGAPRSPARPF